MSRTIPGLEMPRPVSRPSLSPTDQPPQGAPRRSEDKIFTRSHGNATESRNRDGNFARSFYRAQNFYQQVRRTFDPNHGIAPGQSRSTFYMPAQELPPLDPSRHQAAVNAAIQAHRGRPYLLPALTGNDVHVDF